MLVSMKLMACSVHQIIQLDWQESTAGFIPGFTLRAELDDVTKYLPVVASDRWPYTLDGDYLAIDSTHAIFIWNWRDDTVCAMVDLSGSEWVCTRYGRSGMPDHPRLS